MEIELDYSLLKSKQSLNNNKNNDRELIENIIDAIRNKELVPFNMLFKLMKYKYDNAKGQKEIDKIIAIFMIDEDLSNNYLNKLIKDGINDNNQEHYNISYSILKFSLKNEQKKNFIKYTDETIKNKQNELWFTEVSIIDYFNEFILFFENNINENNKKDSLNIIDYKIDILFDVFNVDFYKYNFPPINNNKNYIYNFFFREFIFIISLFRNKRKNKIFDVSDQSSNTRENNDNYTKYKTIEEKFDEYYKLSKFLGYLKEMKYDNNERKNYIKLRIICFYLYLFEQKRSFDLFKINLVIKVIKSLNSEDISEKILEKYKMFKTNEEEFITKTEWKNLNIHDFINIKCILSNIKTNIKSFNSGIMNLEVAQFMECIENYQFEFLNFEGLLNNNYIKINQKIENEFKYILFDLLKSDNCEYFFLKDERFSSYKYVFKSRFAKDIFDEIYQYIYIVPFPVKDFLSLNMRNQYSIFINNHNLIEDNPLKIISILHAYMNDIYHEIYHNISILYSANFDLNLNNTPTKIDPNLVKLQEDIKKKYSLKYEKIVEKINDMGDYMEICYYGIRPKCFCTYSSLYFFNNRTITNDLFKKNYFELFISNVEISQKELSLFFDGDDLNQNEKDISLDEEKEGNNILELEKKEESKKLKENIKDLFNIKIMKLLFEVFKLKKFQIISNNSYIHSNPRRVDYGILSNMEYIREGICHVNRRGTIRANEC